MELDLGSVRASALKNNLNIQVELLSIDGAQATLEEARAITDPTLSASLNRSSNNSPAAQDTQGSQNDNSSASLGLTMPLRRGQLGRPPSLVPLFHQRCVQSVVVQRRPTGRDLPSPSTKGQASRISNEASELPKPSWISQS